MNRAIARRVATVIIAGVMTVTATTANAEAVPVGPLDIDTSTLSQVTTSDCAQVPITFYLVTAPADVEDWVVDGDIVDSAGASRGSVFEYETLPVSQATDTYSICGLPMGTSTFTLAVDIRAYGHDLDSFHEGRYIKTFYITRNAVVTPPPAPAKGKSELKLGRVRLQEKASHVKVVVAVKVRGCTEDRALVLRATNPNYSRWAKVKAARITTRGVVSAKVPAKFTRARFYLAEGPTCKSDISSTIKLPDRR